MGTDDLFKKRRAARKQRNIKHPEPILFLVLQKGRGQNRYIFRILIWQSAKVKKEAIRLRGAIKHAKRRMAEFNSDKDKHMF